VGFGRHHGPQDPFGDVDVVVEVHAVATGGDRPVLASDGVRVLTRVELAHQDLESRFEFFDREDERKFVEHVRGTLAVLTHGL